VTFGPSPLRRRVRHQPGRLPRRNCDLRNNDAGAIHRERDCRVMEEKNLK
jgi:hypothetical protein